MSFQDPYDNPFAEPTQQYGSGNAQGETGNDVIDENQNHYGYGHTTNDYGNYGTGQDGNHVDYAQYGSGNQGPGGSFSGQQGAEHSYYGYHNQTANQTDSNPETERRESVTQQLYSHPDVTQTIYQEIPKHQSFTKAQSPFKSISLTEPEKVGDFTVYKLTVIKASDGQCLVQQRRYQQFAWLFAQLVHKNPGVVVPALPEKRTIGRFDAEFVEARRHFLERFLRKINVHPMLMGNQDFKTFMESSSLDDFTKKDSKGIFDMVGGVFSDTTSFIKSHFSDTFHDNKREEILKLEMQLRKLQKKVETIVKQRKVLGNSVAGFWNDISTIKEESEIFSSLSQLGAIQLKVEEVHSRESQQYVLNFGYTVEEYIRLLDSIKIAMNARAMGCRMYHAANDKLVSKKARLDKVMGQPDKGTLVTQIVQEVEQAQKEADIGKKNFEEIDLVCKSELDRFQQDMKLDLQESMKSYVHKMVEAQAEITHWWEDYLPEMNQQLQS